MLPAMYRDCTDRFWPHSNSSWSHNPAGDKAAKAALPGLWREYQEQAYDLRLLGSDIVYTRGQEAVRQILSTLEEIFWVADHQGWVGLGNWACRQAGKWEKDLADD